MPHQCTNCGRIFPDGSKEMLSGCPDCGGNKFQFRPEGSLDDEGSEPEPTPPAASSEEADERHPDASGPSPPDPDSDASSPSSADAPVTDEGTADPDSAAGDAADPAPIGAVTPDADGETEDRAQADARSEFVTRDELSVAARSSADEDDRETDDAADPDPEDRPGLDDLRDELNDQFESIKIVNPGQYELNLMELYDREEYIISLREDGRYIIEVPETWRRTGDENP